MKAAGARLLEPIMAVEVTTPEEHVGDVLGSLNSRRGVVQDMSDAPGGARIIKAHVPLADMFSYVSTLRSATRGRAAYSMQLHAYAVVPKHLQDAILANAAGVRVRTA